LNYELFNTRDLLYTQFNISGRIVAGKRYYVELKEQIEGLNDLIIANAIYAQVLFQHFEKQLKKFELKSLMQSNNFEEGDGKLNFSKN